MCLRSFKSPFEFAPGICSSDPTKFFTCHGSTSGVHCGCVGSFGFSSVCVGSFGV